MHDGGKKSRLPEAGTVGAVCGTGARIQGPDSDFSRASLRVLGQNKFGLGALLRSKANSKLHANESALERLILYSGAILQDALAGIKGLVERHPAMPPPP
jgi:hypothetical protein